MEETTPAAPSRGRPPFSDAVKAAVLADYKDTNMPVTEIAKKHGVSTPTVHSWARAAGMRRNSASYTKSKERILRQAALEDGCSVSVGGLTVNGKSESFKVDDMRARVENALGNLTIKTA